MNHAHRRSFPRGHARVRPNGSPSHTHTPPLPPQIPQPTNPAHSSRLSEGDLGEHPLLCSPKIGDGPRHTHTSQRKPLHFATFARDPLAGSAAEISPHQITCQMPTACTLHGASRPTTIHGSSPTPRVYRSCTNFSLTITGPPTYADRRYSKVHDPLTFASQR